MTAREVKGPDQTQGMGAENRRQGREGEFRIGFASLRFASGRDSGFGGVKAIHFGRARSRYIGPDGIGRRAEPSGCTGGNLGAVTDLPDFHIPHAEKIEWMIETHGWALELVAARIGTTRLIDNIAVLPAGTA